MSAPASVCIRVLAPKAADLEELVSRDGVLGFRTSIEARKACCEIELTTDSGAEQDGSGI